MGYFTNLYVVEVGSTGEAIETRTSIYQSDVGPTAYFSWGPGVRPPGLYSYADGTVMCDAQIGLLPGYPLVESYDDDPNRCLLEADFRPKQAKDPVLFHFVLPQNFIPRRDMKPLEQPTRPFIFVQDNRIVTTYPVVGQAAIRFWISRLQDDETVADYQLEQLLHPDEERPHKIGIEVNLGIFKIRYN